MVHVKTKWSFYRGETARNINECFLKAPKGLTCKHDNKDKPTKIQVSFRFIVLFMKIQYKLYWHLISDLCHEQARNAKESEA